MLMRPVVIALTSAVLFLVTQWPLTTYATVYSGPMVAVPESVGTFTWGDGTNSLSQEWSVNNVNSSGYVYGSPNLGVYNKGHVSATAVPNADTFPYVTSPILFTEGDTVFFHGANGYYGAWHVDDVYPTGRTTLPYANLNGTWYFQSDGSGNFTPVPEPSSFIFLAGALGLATVSSRSMNKRPKRL